LGSTTGTEAEASTHLEAHRPLLASLEEIEGGGCTINLPQVRPHVSQDTKTGKWQRPFAKVRHFVSQGEEQTPLRCSNSDGPIGRYLKTDHDSPFKKRKKARLATNPVVRTPVVWWAALD